MTITPDETIYAQWGPFVLNATLVYTWAVMAILVSASVLITRRLSTGGELSRWQNLLEVVVQGARDQIREIGRQNPDRYLGLVGTLFIFILVANLLTIVPGYRAPTASLSTTAALAVIVFVATPVYGVARQGLSGYLRHYIEPTPFMLPFNIIGELSRTIALAVRLYGNIMSGAMIVAILLALAPLFFPIVMQALGLVTGVIQAYIFAVLAMVYIAAGTRVHDRGHKDETQGG